MRTYNPRIGKASCVADISNLYLQTMGVMQDGVWFNCVGSTCLQRLQRGVQSWQKRTEAF